MACCQFTQLLDALKGALCMPEFPFQSGSLSMSVGSVPASSRGTTIATGATADAKGAWVELTASTPFAAQWALVSIGNIQQLNTHHSIDIAIGGSGSEQIIMADLYVQDRDSGSNGAFLFPIHIPAGTRIAARAAEHSGAGGNDVDVAINLFAGGACSPGAAPGVVSTYGNVGSATPVNIDPGGANSDSGWVELTSATALDHNWFILTGAFGDFNLAARTTWLVDLAVGGAGSEQVIVSDLFFSAGVTGDRPFSSVATLPFFVPRGNRISARVRSSSATDGDRDVWLRLYGV